MGVFTDIARLWAGQAEAVEPAAGSASLAETARADAAILEAVTSCVMVTDADYVIRRVNRSAQAMLQRVEPQLREVLPAFSAAGLIGSSIDQFHRDPARQRAMLDKLQEPYHGSIKLPAVQFELIISPLFDNDGSRQGMVVEWTDVTERLRCERERQDLQERENSAAAFNQRIRVALEAVTSNVMVADADGVIVFANRSVLDMLRHAEADLRKDLPQFSADRVVGQNFDVFHKTPQRQRNLLGALRETFRTVITVGGHRFSLIASPVFGEGQQRLGTVVEWQDLKFEQEFESVVDAAIRDAIAGNLATRIETQGRTGLIAKVSASINQLLGIFESVIRDVSVSVTALAQGDLTHRIDTPYTGSYRELQESVNGTIDSLSRVVSDIVSASDQVQSSAAEIATGNTDLSQRTEEQAASLEETSAVMDELSTTVQNNAANSGQAMTLAGEAHTIADKGSSVVQETLASMQEISAASKRIADIIDVIDQIAFQTNMLSLNAAVEAARAGDQGKGFSVVASEVRNLAGRCATAAREIGELIKDSADKVDRGARLAQRSAQTFDEIVAAVKKVHSIIDEIGLASAEQSRGIEEVTRTVTQLDEMTQQNAALVEESAAASEMLDRQAGNLRQLISFFRMAKRR